MDEVVVTIAVGSIIGSILGHIIWKLFESR